MTFKGFIEMYRDGFKSMTIGKTLWLIVAIKLAFMFLILKIFFFPNILSRDYETDADRAEAVRGNLTEVYTPELPIISTNYQF